MPSAPLVIVLSVCLLHDWGNAAPDSSKVKGTVESLTSETVDQFLYGEAALIEFYAPWCGACQQFERSYNMVAKALNEDNVKVGKVNIDDNQALASRFGIRHLPTVYLVKDGEVYIYDGSRSFEDVVAFAQRKYKDTEPIPYWSSPLGPVGYSKGLLTRIGIALVNVQPYIMDTLGVSQFVSYALSALLAGISLCVLLGLAVYIHVAHEKTD